MIRFTETVTARLRKMEPTRILAALGEELEAGADAVVETARFNLNDGALSGSGHIPGPPGSYSKSDTHELEQSFHRGETIASPGEVSTSAIADAPWAIYQELGTSKMQPRPNMQLAVGENRKKIARALGQRFIREVNG